MYHVSQKMHHFIFLTHGVQCYCRPTYAFHCRQKSCTKPRPAALTFSHHRDPSLNTMFGFLPCSMTIRLASSSVSITFDVSHSYLIFILVGLIVSGHDFLSNVGQHNDDVFVKSTDFLSLILSCTVP